MFYRNIIFIAACIIPLMGCMASSTPSSSQRQLSEREAEALGAYFNVAAGLHLAELACPQYHEIMLNNYVNSSLLLGNAFRSNGDSHQVAGERLKTMTSTGKEIATDLVNIYKTRECNEHIGSLIADARQDADCMTTYLTGKSTNTCFSFRQPRPPKLSLPVSQQEHVIGTTLAMYGYMMLSAGVEMAHKHCPQFSTEMRLRQTQNTQVLEKAMSDSGTTREDINVAIRDMTLAGREFTDAMLRLAPVMGCEDRAKRFIEITRKDADCIAPYLTGNATSQCLAALEEVKRKIESARK